MTEYRLTDGKTIVIETARTAAMAMSAGAARLGCTESEITIMEEKKKPTTAREAKQQGYWERYADYLLRVQRKSTQPHKRKLPNFGGIGETRPSHRPAVGALPEGEPRQRKSAPAAATTRDTKQNTSI